MKEKSLFWVKILKGFIFWSLTLGFCWTSYFNLVDFISEKETTSTRVDYVVKGLELPAITICNKRGYKNIERNLKLQDYLKNTMDLKDFLVGVYHSDLANENFFEDFLEVTQLWLTSFIDLPI